MTFDLRVTPYDHADALLLTELVQAVYVERYGSPDVAPIDASHFELPGGYFVIAYVEGTPAAMAAGGGTVSPMQRSSVCMCATDTEAAGWPEWF